MKRRPVCKLDASQGQGRGHPLATPVNQSTESNGSNLALPHSNGRVERTNKEGSLNQGLKMAFHNPNDGKKQMMFFYFRQSCSRHPCYYRRWRWYTARTHTDLVHLKLQLIECLVLERRLSHFGSVLQGFFSRLVKRPLDEKARHKQKKATMPVQTARRFTSAESIDLSASSALQRRRRVIN